MKEYLKLLAQREFKVVLGSKWANLWLLTLVLIATFLSIAFSNGSMLYLEEKMNDPFTNWVNIQKNFGSDDFDEFRNTLVGNSELQAHYGYEDVQCDNYLPLNMLGRNGSEHYLQCRFFEHLNSPLIKKVIDEDNVIANCSIDKAKLDDQSLGLIITQESLLKLGYSIDSIPAYVNYMSYSRGADTLGFQMIEGKYVATPLPLLAVVRRLPMNMDMVASHYLYEQYNNGDRFPLNMNNQEYARELYYYVPDGCTDFESSVSSLIPDSLKDSFSIYTNDISYIESWKKGSISRIYVGDLSTSNADLINIDKSIQAACLECTRVYRYDVSDYSVSERRLMSVNFANLDSIRAFEQFAKDNYNVQIEMSQINSKETFNDVSILAKILSYAMIIFSVICIILFIVNMLQNYFQKVRRNIGTFKAFGIDSNDLILVYELILLVIVTVSVVLAFLTTYIIQILLPLFGVLKEGTYNYLSLICTETLVSVSIVVISTIATVYIVMRKLIQNSPGDLIYDR